MGIDRHALNFIKLAKDKRPLGSTITIGRQGLHLPEDEVKAADPRRHRLSPRRLLREPAA